MTQPQTTSDPEPRGRMERLTQFFKRLTNLFLAIGAMAAALAGWSLPKFFDWLKSQTQIAASQPPTVTNAGASAPADLPGGNTAKHTDYSPAMGATRGRRSEPRHSGQPRAPQRVVRVQLHDAEPRSISRGTIELGGRPVRAGSSGLIEVNVLDTRLLTLNIDIPGYQQSTTSVQPMPVDDPGEPVHIYLRPQPSN